MAHDTKNRILSPRITSSRRCTMTMRPVTSHPRNSKHLFPFLLVSIHEDECRRMSNATINACNLLFASLRLVITSGNFSRDTNLLKALQRTFFLSRINSERSARSRRIAFVEMRFLDWYIGVAVYPDFLTQILCSHENRPRGAGFIFPG